MQPHAEVSMTLNWDVANPSSSDSSDRSPLQDRANRDIAFSRREFLGMTAASLLMAGTLGGAAAQDRKNGIPTGRWAAPVRRFRWLDSAVSSGAASDTQESVRIIRNRPR